MTPSDFRSANGIRHPKGLKHTALLLLLAYLGYSACSVFAGDLLLQGKCVIPETSSTFAQCTVINDGSSIIVLTGRSQALSLKLFISNILLSGRLSPEFENNSPLLRTNIVRSLAEIGTGIGDAQNSSNVRAMQFNRDATIQTLIFIADRSGRNVGEVSSLIPNKILNQQAGADLAPSDGREILAAFDREFERCETLYEALMFEEGDRVLDLVIAKAKLFREQYLGKPGSESISNVLISKATQLQRFRDYKAFDRILEEQEAERNFDNLQRIQAEKEKQRREYNYKMAQEYRRSLEAIALRWYSYWGVSRSTNIYILK